MKRIATVSFLPLALFAVTARQEILPDIEKGGPPVKGGSERVTDRPGNRMGSVPVIMYHRFGEEESFMVRSYQNFRNDLLRLYNMGFRPVTLNEFVTNQMQLPRGASPVVLSFDDSHPTQFTFLDNGEIDPDCALGIWSEFAETYPDFPVKGTFFVLPNGPFGQTRLREKKMAFLKESGSEVGSHTMSHAALNELEDEEVMKELADSYNFVTKLGFTARSFATPYGIAPKNRELLENFEWDGFQYGYDNICLAGSSMAPSPLSQALDRARIPRIQAYDGPFGIVYWLNRISNGKSAPYVQP